MKVKGVEIEISPSPKFKVCNVLPLSKKKYHLFVRRNSSETNEPSNHPNISEELDRSGGVHEGEFLKIGPELVVQDALKEKKYDLE